MDVKNTEPKNKRHASAAKRTADSEQDDDDNVVDGTFKNEDKDETGSDDDEEEGDEYEVERVVGHKRERGVLSFLLKWKGYEDADNTWETNDNLSCEELINEYWEKYEKAGGKKSDTKGSESKPQIAKRATSIAPASNTQSQSPVKQSAQRKSDGQKQETSTKALTKIPTKLATASPAKSPAKSTTQVTKKKTRDDDSAMRSTTKKQKVETPVEEIVQPSTEVEDNEASEQDENGNKEGDSEWVPPKSWTSWDEHLDSVQTVERTKRSMTIHLAWKNGKYTEHPIEEAHEKCPQTLIRFYESHLKFTQA
ncbi:hypothetical protein BGZ46_000215 [Entomortierella lignicola]|nr:hypothetical protein BGZ46_000215 [Entomortierella lignicola]